MAESSKTPPKPAGAPATGRKAVVAPVKQDYSFTTLVPKDVNIDFVGKRKFFLLLSTLLNLAAIGLLLTRGLNLGIDFKGGTDIRLRFSEQTTASAVRDELAELNLRDLTVQDFGEQGKEFLLRFETQEGQEMATITDTLKALLQKGHPGDKSFEILSVESVGPRVGSELRRRGFMAVAVATLFMGFYVAIRFDLSFGVGAVIALIHDVLITLGALILTRMAFDLTTLAAVLTVVGFSIHDTIIVSDRIREKLRKDRKAPLAQVINQSINETLSRTLLTTGTALLVLLALLLLGGKGLQPFAVALIVGFITGTYSSIYIAAPVVLFWADRLKMGANKA
ncbi:MAG: protein translocase subunit SecF [Deltaproteobacteria bacterium]